MIKILLVEPDLLLAKIYQKSFKEQALDIKICHSAQSAIDAVEDYKPDCMIIEPQLAGHSGVELLHELRSYEDLKNMTIYLYSNLPVQNINSVAKSLKSLNIKGAFAKSSFSVKQLIGQIKSDISS